MLFHHYVINDDLVFYPHKRIIHCISTKKKNVLHTSGSLCLKLIVDKKGRTVTQAEIMDIGWGNRVVTQASYYQCLVNLRKQILDTGFTENVVVTVPREGIRINDELKVKIVSPAPAPELMPAAESELKPPPERQPERLMPVVYRHPLSTKNRKYPLKITLFCITAIISMLAIYICKNSNSYQSDKYAFSAYPGTDKCYQFSKQTAKKLRALSADTLKKYGYTCKPDKKYLIHKLASSPQLSFFICHDDKKNKHCKSATIIQ
jgi:DNA-binding winged helix-turn-helix (wHTH) protein